MTSTIIQLTVCFHWVSLDVNSVQAVQAEAVDVDHSVNQWLRRETCGMKTATVSDTVDQGSLPNPSRA